MKDPIERQDAIEVVKRQRKIAWENWHETRPSAERIIEDLKELPSAQLEVDCQKCVFCGFAGFKQFQTAQPKRMRGKWKEHKDYPNLAFLCSECGYFTTMRSHFCPNCGVKMINVRGE